MASAANKMLRTPAMIVLLGAPGAGKGTYASKIASRWRIPHISTGDMIRSEIASQSVLGEQLKEFTSKGLLVPDDTINEIAKKRLAQKDARERGYLLDGYPRTIDQAISLATHAAPQLCLNITMPDEFLIAKIAGRRLCKNCGCNYNVADIASGKYLMPPLLPKVDGVCDKCEKPLEILQREDDREDIVKERLQVYKQSTEPLIKFYETLGILVPFEVYRGVEDLPAIMELLLQRLGVEVPTDEPTQRHISTTQNAV